jgi:hypothetical protein
MQTEPPSKEDAAAIATLQLNVPMLRQQVGQFIAKVTDAMESHSAPPMCPIFGSDVQIVALSLTNLGFLAHADSLRFAFNELSSKAIRSLQERNTDDPELKLGDFLFMACLLDVELERIERICRIPIAANQPDCIPVVQEGDDARPRVAADSEDSLNATDTQKKKSQGRKRLPRLFGKLHRECGLAYVRASRKDPSQTLKSFAESWLIDNSSRFKKPPSIATFYKSLCDNRSHWDSGHTTDSK